MFCFAILQYRAEDITILLASPRPKSSQTTKVSARDSIKASHDARRGKFYDQHFTSPVCQWLPEVPSENPPVSHIYRINKRVHDQYIIRYTHFRSLTLSSYVQNEWMVRNKWNLIQVNNTNFALSHVQSTVKVFFFVLELWCSVAIQNAVIINSLKDQTASGISDTPLILGART